LLGSVYKRQPSNLPTVDIKQSAEKNSLLRAEQHNISEALQLYAESLLKMLLHKLAQGREAVFLEFNRKFRVLSVRKRSELSAL